MLSEILEKVNLIINVLFVSLQVRVSVYLITYQLRQIEDEQKIYRFRAKGVNELIIGLGPGNNKDFDCNIYFDDR